VLVVLTSAFGRSFDAFDGNIMQGVAHVLNNYDASELDLDRLVVQLRDIPPRQLRARASALREAHRGTLPRLCAAVIVERYNAARGRRIEDFLVRVPELAKGGREYTRNRQERRRKAEQPTPPAEASPVDLAEPAREVVEPDVELFDEIRTRAASEPLGDVVQILASGPMEVLGLKPDPSTLPVLCKCGHAERRHEDDGCRICTDCAGYTESIA
jgi:hypothetical protein